MKSSILRAAAALSLAAAAFLAPTAANAYTDPFVVVATPSTFAAGNVSVFTTDEAPFQGDEEIAISVTGENANGVTLGVVKAVRETSTSLRTRGVAGKLNVPLRFPSTASGRYDLTFTGLTSGVVAHASVFVTAPTSPSTGGLAVTGSDPGSTVGLWVAGGALVATGTVLGVGAAARRRRHSGV